jgi:hypothetical protein
VYGESFPMDRQWIMLLEITSNRAALVVISVLQSIFESLKISLLVSRWVIEAPTTVLHVFFTSFKYINPVIVEQSSTKLFK